MEIVFSEQIDIDIADFKKSGNYKRVKKKIDSLLKSIKKDPFSGIGKPELLKWDLSGRWSRHILGKDRMIYRVFEGAQRVEILSLKGHYGDK